LIFVLIFIPELTSWKNSLQLSMMLKVLSFLTKSPPKKISEDRQNASRY